MKIEKLLDVHVLTGIVLGAVIGIYHPLDAYKELLVVLPIVMGVRVVATK